MNLGGLLEEIRDYNLDGPHDREIRGIAYDSRKIRTGDLFVAIRGHLQDGHDYLCEAVKNGAVALVAEEFKEELGEGISRIRVNDSRSTLSKLAVRFYGYPCEDITVLGVTGTNGKTSVTYILESILLAAGLNPGVIGTINCRFKGKVRSTNVTTPESLDLMRIIREMVDDGITHVALEVSSHALDQRRVEECRFNVGIFTNLSRDHLDYHNTMDEYFHAKSLLFKGMRPGGGRIKSVAVINQDDPKGNDLITRTSADVLTYGFADGCDLSAKDVFIGADGIKATLLTPEGEVRIRSSLIGRINLYNILAATGAALGLGIDINIIAEGLNRFIRVPGRLEPVENNKGLKIVVDYAHTPDALLKVQETLRPLVKGRLITVFGCGGDRDRGKRFDMGLVAGENSDIAVITSDNPRSEDPYSIIKEIEKGVICSGMKMAEQQPGSEINYPAYLVQIDRRMAINKAVSMADEKDIVLIAGKGHEDYQIVGTEKRSFDDKEEAALAANDG
jgi:UDP-N-acetylmuramoyl-L-alanyl-D-glutamate--2,6-diaminopimelate ligase